MALFQGEEMVNVTTPDGRTLTLPRSIVPTALMPQQIAAAPPAAPIGAPSPVTAPPALPTAGDFAELTPTPAPAATSGTSVVEMGEPDVTPVTVMEPMVVKPNKKRLEKARKADAAYKASPQGQLAAASGEQTAALQESRDAMLGANEVEAATNEVVADALKEQNVQIADRERARIEEMQAHANAENAKMEEVIGMRKKIEGTKIDRKLDHPVLAAIFAGLAGLGSAMKGEKIDTLDILYRVIDRKVAGQEADLDQMGKVYGMTKDELAMLKEKSKSRLEFHNMMVAAEVEKAARTIEELTARSASEKTRANGKVMAAQMRERAAGLTMDAVRWGLEFDQKDRHQKQQIGLGYANLAETKRAHKEGEKIRREEIAADLAKALAADRAKGDLEAYKMRMEAAKEARQFGVRDTNGNFFLSPEGRAKMAEAAALEAEAKKLESNPDVMSRSIASGKVEMLRQKAAILRGDAESMNAIKAHNETEAIAVSGQIAAAQSTAQLVDDIKALSDQVGRGLISRDVSQVKLRAMFNLMKPALKEAWQLGAWDKGASNLTDTIIGLDPTSDWNVDWLGAAIHQQMIEDPKAFQHGLDAVVEQLERTAKGKLTSLGNKFGAGETVLQRAQKPELSSSAEKLSKERTGSELTKNAEEAGVAAKVGRKAYQAIVDINAPNHGEEAEAAQSLRYPGMSRAQEAPFEERLRAYKNGDKRAGEELVALVADAAAKNRYDFAVPLLHNLRDQAPSLYKAARSALPKDSDVDKQMAFEETTRIGNSFTDSVILRNQVLNSIDDTGQLGDKEGAAELARRAGQGDAIAKRALVDMAAQIGANKTLPRGSVFRGRTP